MAMYVKDVEVDNTKRCGSYTDGRGLSIESEHTHIRENKLAITIEIQYPGLTVLSTSMSKDIMNIIRKDYFH